MVKSSAEEALDEIDKVVRKPEIKDISKSLLNALKDPSAYTSTALEALIETEFVHAIDAPSLALIVPVIHRGLRDRTAITKRFGAMTAGNLVTMINDPKDFLQYVPLLIADLKATFVDPIPDCRSTAAKSLGSLTKAMLALPKKVVQRKDYQRCCVPVVLIWWKECYEKKYCPYEVFQNQV
jgi:hypothetical protein